MRKKKVAKSSVPMTTVIRDTRNGNLDYQMPLAEAKKLYDEGKLVMDLTNGKYSSDFGK